jgi:hypothetical protein
MTTATENSIDFATHTEDLSGRVSVGVQERLEAAGREYHAHRMELLSQDTGFAMAWRSLRTAYQEAGCYRVTVPADQRGSFSITLSMDHCASFSTAPSARVPHNPAWNECINDAVAAWKVAQTERQTSFAPARGAREVMVAEFCRAWGLDPQYTSEQLDIGGPLQAAIAAEHVEEEARASMEGASTSTTEN